MRRKNPRCEKTAAGRSPALNKKMKALSTIGLTIAAFLLFLGITSRSAAGAVLSNAVIAGGAFIILVVAGSWIAVRIKNRKEGGSRTND